MMTLFPNGRHVSERKVRPPWIQNISVLPYFLYEILLLQGTFDRLDLTIWQCKLYNPTAYICDLTILPSRLDGRDRSHAATSRNRDSLPTPVPHQV